MKRNQSGMGVRQSHEPRPGLEGSDQGVLEILTFPENEPIPQMEKHGTRVAKLSSYFRIWEKCRVANVCGK